MNYLDSNTTRLDASFFASPNVATFDSTRVDESDKAVDEMTKRGYELDAAHDSSAPAESLARPWSIAIVEDDSELVRFYELAIRKIGYGTPFVARDGSMAVEAIVRQKIVRPEVMIMDYNMPNMNGLEAARKIHAAYPSIRIIVATADEAAIEKAMDMGLETALKPFSLSHLVGLLQGKR